MPSNSSHAYSAGKFLIELEGVSVGFASSVEGGEVVGEVAEEASDPSGLVKKHISRIRWEPIVIEIGLGMGKELADWVIAFVARKAAAKNGAVVFLDFNGQVRARLEWTHGQMVEVRFPALDGADHSAGEITVIIQPERTTLKSGGGGGKVNFGQKTQKAWLRSNFRVAIDNIPNDAKFVSKVEAIVVRRPLTEYRDGAMRESTFIPGPQQVSDVVLSVAEAHSAEFALWAEDFLIQGKASDNDERNGTLDFLSPSFEVLASLSLRHLGIIRVARERVESGNSVVARVKVHLYCEEVLFAVAAAALPARIAAVAEAPAQPAATLAASRRLAVASDLPRAASARRNAIAARLLASDDAAGASGNAEQQDGFAIGQLWAAEQASLEEFAGLAQLEDPAWTAIALPRDHSLIAALSAAGVLPSGETGPIDLQRGPLVDGIVQGIAKVADQLASAAEMGETESLRLQMMMDRRSKMMQTLSNLMKKNADTAAAIVQNLK